MVEDKPESISKQKINLYDEQQQEMPIKFSLSHSEKGGARGSVSKQTKKKNNKSKIPKGKK
jgi:hypothetical protein